MKNDVKQKASSFIKEYGSITDSSDLQRIIEKQGYTIVFYNSIFNDENVQCIIDELSLEPVISKSRGFTFVNENYRLVFVNEDLSEQEKKIVLAHEEGHIYCEHFHSDNIIGKDVIDEHEANEFSHYILNVSFKQRAFETFKSHKKLCVILLVLIFMVSAFSVGFAIHTQSQNYYGEYYVTESGQKYHKKDCMTIKDRSKVHRLTKEEYDSGEYEACEVCLPDE